MGKILNKDLYLAAITHLARFTHLLLMLPGPEEGPEVHDEGEHGAERADDQPDQPGDRGVPREVAGGRARSGEGKEGTGHPLNAQAS